MCAFPFAPLWRVRRWKVFGSERRDRPKLDFVSACVLGSVRVL